MKTIAISGASGFLGTSLLFYFKNLGYKTIIIKRSFLKDKKKLNSLIGQSNIVINLAGTSIINRWSEEYKKLLYSSRIDTTKILVRAINDLDKKPELFISTSAVGIYNNKDKHDENGFFANDFLSLLCQDWEKEANKANTNVAICRLGIVLGKNGGAFKKMITPFKLGLGGDLGNGKQAFSYIHIEDLLNAYNFIINKNLSGIFNLTSPNPTTNHIFTKSLGKELKRPTLFSIPNFILKLIFSEGAKVLTDSQNVVPQRLLNEGFEFKYDNISKTVKSLTQ